MAFSTNKSRDLFQDFELVQVGQTGRFLPAKPKDATDLKQSNIHLPLHTLPFGVPPIPSPVDEYLDDVLNSIEKFPIHEDPAQIHLLPRHKNADALRHLEVSSLKTTIVVDRNPDTGELLGYKEELIEKGGNSKNSTSLNRQPGPPDDSLRGSSTNLPFWPGGLDEPLINPISQSTETGSSLDLDFSKDLLTTPPGFDCGMHFESKSLSKILDSLSESAADSVQFTDLLDVDEDEFNMFMDEKPIDSEKQHDSIEQIPASPTDDSLSDEFNSVLKLDVKSEELNKDLIKEEQSVSWAVQVDISSPVEHFHKTIPDMAYKWPFELDIFQKQAILHLEQHDNVFVSAHTSAGKTVIAEYAIALSMKHMTRTIYTSPLKALSNQKFRDFKLTFKDVGLVTGDVQINQDASCLVMTTEILRSMLYNGSDVIRDLEWVVFDEVHYINDSERGVVWEEVLIMLPQHVNIILLSATVPNTLEFAEWVGRTKKRKVFVVSTSKRPVPLEHFLYTGNSAKTSDQMFKILDSKKSFITSGYNKSIEAKKDRASKQSQNFGPKGTRGGNPAQDKNVWLSIIEMLRKKEKLPVVSFVFSKKKIEEIAANLQSVDLTTATEKNEIHVFLQRCLSKLKGSDKELPQVLYMQDILKRGLGMHHSGILPILKEVIELLFQRGLIKVLFATETFAMGVNMPTRTVIFDSIRKHDGLKFRNLLPGEYIQMAGRAGRRGLDTTGTVIILIKGDVPEMSEFHKMMLGKPTLLQSQFRLTYSMILNLLRVEQLRVEDMMKRSFSEFHNQKDTMHNKERLGELSQQIESLPEILDYAGDLEEYYKTCASYWTLKKELQQVVLSHPQAAKCLVPGRVIVIDTEEYKNNAALVLSVSSVTSSRQRTLTCLILSEHSSTSSDIKVETGEQSEDFTSCPQPLLSNRLFYPEGQCLHKIVDVSSDAITAITTTCIKVNAVAVIDDFKKRQLARFKDDPPGPSFTAASQEFQRLIEQHPTLGNRSKKNDSDLSSPCSLLPLDPLSDLKLRDIELVEQFRELEFLEQKLLTEFHCTQASNFKENYSQMCSNMKVKEEYSKMLFLLSDESLQLLPEYQQRVNVLKSLQHIDGLRAVQLKGRVACEINQHELIITELIFENVLNDLHPAEVASLFSCVVFQQKNSSEPNLSPSLVKAKESFLKTATKIGQIQKECGLTMPVGDYLAEFNFNLMEVVFEWARGMPFAEITELTDVQEGIIVRCIQRLDDVLHDIRDAARIIGDPMLVQKMDESSSMIKRDIVFAASLYTQ